MNVTAKKKKKNKTKNKSKFRGEKNPKLHKEACMQILVKYQKTLC